MDEKPNIVDIKIDLNQRTNWCSCTNVKTGEEKFVVPSDNDLPFEIVVISAKQARLEGKLRKVRAAEYMSKRGDNSLIQYLIDDEETLEILQNVINERDPFMYL